MAENPEVATIDGGVTEQVDKSPRVANTGPRAGAAELSNFEIVTN
jgi:hypothetical protein